MKSDTHIDIQRKSVYRTERSGERVYVGKNPINKAVPETAGPWGAWPCAWALRSALGLARHGQDKSRGATRQPSQATRVALVERSRVAARSEAVAEPKGVSPVPVRP